MLGLHPDGPDPKLIVIGLLALLNTSTELASKDPLKNPKQRRKDKKLPSDFLKLPRDKNMSSE
jgi:hypothetical protein